MHPLLESMLPELILITVACALLLMGASPRAAVRRVVPFLALSALVVVFFYQVTRDGRAETLTDATQTFRIFRLAEFIKMLAAGVGILFILLAWPSNPDATGNAALDYASEAGEFFGLMLLSIAGVFLVAGANDIILLFLGIELASLPTYIMVSISRPIPAAQEAGVKYFFLGALAAALMLFGFSYLYGTTGAINLDVIGAKFLGLWQLNIKRLFACSSIAHSGYMLVGIAALTAAGTWMGTTPPSEFAQLDVIRRVQQEALQGVLFYLAAYGIMNAGAFGVL